MATFRSALRSYSAAVRRMDREDKRRASAAAKRFKEQQKSQDIEDAKSAVENWENYVELLQTMHKECTDPIDWQEFIDAIQPDAPIDTQKHTKGIQYKIDNFKPSVLDKLFLDKFFSSIEKKQKKLEQQLVEAIQKDQEIHIANLEKHKQECEEIDYLKAMANGVLAMNAKSHKSAIEYFEPFSDVNHLGSSIEMQFEDELVEASIHIHSDDLIPDYTLSQTSTGKLSKKKMSKSAFNALYQDHVCSAVLRVAGELFNYLLVPYVRVNAIAEMLNTQTGYMERQPILSVIIPRGTLEKINLNTIDPSDSMQNFIHAMKFKKTEGFQPVEKVEWPSK